jgi:MinD-like ATPase involved in chromosome partitioning or flagellar assembly
VTRTVITAIGGSAESQVVAALEATAGYAVARRCADLAELLAAAAAGLGEVALVSADLRALDRSALGELAAHGVRVAGVNTPGDDRGERRLRQLGLAVVLSSDLAPHEFDDALDALDALPGTASALNGPAGALRELGEEPYGSGACTVPGDMVQWDAVQGDAVQGDAVPGDPGPNLAEGGRIIAVWGPTGAPGRSMVTVNLAAELARTAPTLIVDCDTYGSSLSQALGLVDEAPGMAAAARASDQGVLDLLALARLAPEVTSGLRVLTGIPRAERWTELRAPSVSHVLDLSRQLARFVVVDCGFSIEDDEELSYDTLAPRRNAATLAALEAADDLLVVGSAEPVGLQRLVRAVQDLRAAQAPAPRVVVNRVRASSVGSHPERQIAEALERFAGLHDITYLPWDQAPLDGAMLAGTSLAEFAPQSALRRAIADLAASYSGAAPERRRSRRERLRS